MPQIKPAGTATSMTTAEATVDALIAHGIDTIYALPGRAERSSVRGAVQGSATAFATVHTRHEQGAAYMALGAALATGKPQAYAVVPGRACSTPRPRCSPPIRMNAPVLALIGQIPDAAHRPRPRPSARDPRSGRHHHAAGRFFGADPEARTRRRAWSPKPCGRWRRGRPGPAALECAIDVWGRRGSSDAAAAPAAPRARRSTKTRSARPRQAPRRRQAPADRRAAAARRSASAEVTAAVRACCRRRCSAIAAAAACSTAAIRSASRFRSATSCGARPMWCWRRHAHVRSSSGNGASTRASPIIRIDADPEEPARVCTSRPSRSSATPSPFCGACSSAAGAQHHRAVAPRRNGGAPGGMAQAARQSSRRRSPSSSHPRRAAGGRHFGR